MFDIQEKHLQRTRKTKYLRKYKKDVVCADRDYSHWNILISYNCIYEIHMSVFFTNEFEFRNTQFSKFHQIAIFYVKIELILLNILRESANFYLFFQRYSVFSSSFANVEFFKLRT